MSRSLWLALALAALGLWASLVPQVTYPTASSGEPAGDVLVAWPGWAVQQDLGQLSGTIGRFHIWVSSALDGGEHTVQASLVDASTNEVLRQTTIDATPSYTPVSRTLTFPSYVVPEGRRLFLQLEVAAFERRHVIYGLAHAQPEHRNLALNGVPDAGSGPLAFSHQVTSSSLRAALHGKQDARIRFALALVLSGLAALAYPRVAALRRVRRAGAVAKRLTQRATVWGRRLAGPNDEPGAGGPPTARGRVFAVPWYPWPAAIIPILHFLANNPLHFAVLEALVPVIVVMLAVTVAVVGLRLVLRGWHQAAAAATAVTAVIFAYGHVERALDGRLDDYSLFPLAAVLAAAAVWMAARGRVLVANWVTFLNVTAGILLLFQIISLAGAASEISVRAADLFSQSSPDVGGDRPDIYYIILDAYGRNDVLGEFDNADFLTDLERRGFFVATNATSNYRDTIQSLASSLNFAYLDDLGPRAPKTKSDGIALVQNSALAATLKSLGYTYVHLESGNLVSNRAPPADIVVTFTPAGVVVASVEEETRYSPSVRATQVEGFRDSGFLRAFLETTALRPLTGHRFRPGDDSPYDWWAPERTLQMFKFLSEPIQTSGPKFVFAHILKPHGPATFDRHGNMLISQRVDDEFNDAHDPTVPDTYIGQLIFINTLVLRMVDGILKNSSEKPIIVIAADHGRGGYPKHAILAAFHLPGGGSDVLYPSISSVNHFRVILDFYFGLNLGLLEDINLEHASSQFEIPVASTIGGTRR